MQRYALLMEYDGSPFVGYQIQPNGRTVQGELEKALAKIAKLAAGERVWTHASGRTDSGVHALGQVVHFDYPRPISPQGLYRALNTLLDDAIRVRQLVAVDGDFHSRYLAKKKTYRYRVDLGDFADPFKRNFTLHHPYRLDIARIQRSLTVLQGRHDFTSFCSTQTDKTDLVRNLYRVEAHHDPFNQELVFEFEGDGFLYNMIRIIVGTALQIGDGLKDEGEFDRLLRVKDRQEAGPTAGPSGLCLMRVDYEDSPFT